MSATDHARPRKGWLGQREPEHADQAPRYQHRPLPRRAKTNTQATRRAIAETGAVR